MEWPSPGPALTRRRPHRDHRGPTSRCVPMPRPSGGHAEATRSPPGDHPAKLPVDEWSHGDRSRASRRPLGDHRSYTVVSGRIRILSLTMEWASAGPVRVHVGARVAEERRAAALRMHTTEPAPSVMKSPSRPRPRVANRHSIWCRLAPARNQFGVGLDRVQRRSRVPLPVLPAAVRFRDLPQLLAKCR